MDFFKTPHIQIRFPGKDTVFKHAFLVLFIYPWKYLNGHSLPHLYSSSPMSYYQMISPFLHRLSYTNSKKNRQQIRTFTLNNSWLHRIVWYTSENSMKGTVQNSQTITAGVFCAPHKCTSLYMHSWISRSRPVT